MATAAPSFGSSATQLLSLTWDANTREFGASVNLWLVIILFLTICGLMLWRWYAGGWTFKNFEIDQAEIGVGSSKFRFKPNLSDKQVAYAIWVELSTRKIGLPIDLDHDVIVEIYDSWYNFFSVTRDLVKSVPVAQIKRSSTRAIITLSIEVLNEGLRPHLTRWQARFRAWYVRELKRYEATEGDQPLDPQQIQAKFPGFEDLKTDMYRVNDALMRYRNKMHELVLKN